MGAEPGIETIGCAAVITDFLQGDATIATEVVGVRIVPPTPEALHRIVARLVREMDNNSSESRMA